MEKIETERLILREWQEDDYSDFYEFASDKEVTYNSGCNSLKSLEEGKEAIQFRISFNQSYAIVLKESNKVVGSIGMDTVAPDKKLSNLKQRYIGYMLNQNYWNKGYATEATKAFIERLFNEFNLDIIWSSVYNFNEKSNNVLKKCGFKYKFEKDINYEMFKKEKNQVKEMFYAIYRP